VTVREATMATTRAVLAAISEYARAHERFMRAEQQAYEDDVELTEEWVNACDRAFGYELDVDDWDEFEVAELSDEEYEERLEDAQEIKDALGKYLWSGEASPNLPVRRISDLSILRERFVDRLQAAERRHAENEKALVEPHAKLVTVLEKWLESAKTPEGRQRIEQDWPRILKAWRDAVSLTTREAAEVLGVSASAVVRYSRGERTPPFATVGGMVAAIAGHRGAPPSSPQRQAIQEVVRVMGPEWRVEGQHPTATALMEGLEGPKVEFETAIKRQLEQLTTEQLQFVAALTERPDALDALVTFINGDPLAPVRNALRTATR
jgi:transcriptional regulator with XRE-family HTH domain